jgi:hypothetical protein
LTLTGLLMEGVGRGLWYQDVMPYQTASFDTALFCATGDRRIKQIDCP